MPTSSSRASCTTSATSGEIYHEFDEVGLNRQRGYTSSADIIDLYPRFYWDSVAPHLQLAVRYLNVTSSGRQWITNLYGNVFRAEYDLHLSGPKLSQSNRRVPGPRYRRGAPAPSRRDRPSCRALGTDRR